MVLVLRLLRYLHDLGSWKPAHGYDVASCSPVIVICVLSKVNGKPAVTNGYYISAGCCNLVGIVYQWQLGLLEQLL